MSHRLHHCPCTAQLREQMLTEADRILLSDRCRNFPLARGFMEAPGPVAAPPQGSCTIPRFSSGAPTRSHLYIKPSR
eukprot:2878113-Pyramimonas_sp.AAC.1